MRRTTLTITALIAAFALGGCASTTPTAGPDPAPAQSEAATNGESPAPAPATVAPTEPAEEDAESWFLGSGIVEQLELSDEEKIAAAHYACDEVRAGNLAVVAVEGVTAQYNRSFVIDALVAFCPDLSSVYAVS